MSDLDAIIIGQGLAGSLLAWELDQAGCTVLILDNGHYLASSRVAAGLLNPVTGQRLHADSNVQSLLQQAKTTYHALQKQFGEVFFHALPLRRYCRQELEVQRWQQRKQQPLYRELLGNWREKNSDETFMDELGSFEIQHAGRLDIPVLLRCLRQYFRDKDAYSTSKVDYQSIRPGQHNVRVQKRLARFVIFCEGHAIIHNPWANTHCMNLSRGDIMTFQADATKRYIANKGYWYAPTGPHEFKWGASFATSPTHALPTRQAHDELLNALQAFERFPVSHRLIKQESGIRPATLDKSPILGFHSRHSQLGFFNGFGGRGALLIPYYARLFRDVLFGQQSLSRQIDYQRFGERH